MTDYTEVTLETEDPDVLTALLVEAGYEGFWEEEEGRLLRAYTTHYDAAETAALAAVCGARVVSAAGVANRNWNAEWEAEYPSVFVDDFCQIYPAFREPAPGFAYNLRISPQMAFGTGHHETTRLMIRLMRDLTFKDKDVLDMGCGTGVLGILAARMGARSVDLVDIEAEACAVAARNAGDNGVEVARAYTGGVEAIPDRMYDVVAANIQRNVLLADGAAYAAHLRPGGLLLLSGYFDFDSSAIISYFTSITFTCLRQLEDHHWQACCLRKSDG